MKAWKLFLEDLEKKIGVNTVNKWLSSLKILKFDACNLYLEAENHFQASWFQEYIKPILDKGFYNENFHKIKVHLSVKDNKTKEKKTKEKKQDFQPDPINDFATFSLFIASEKNLMPLKLLKEVTTAGSTFNPIYLYGVKSCGKTHLLQACCRKFLENNLKAFYVNAQTFTNHVVDAIRNGNMTEFRNRYRNLDALIIDDIQIFSKKFATQEEFFHTFNSLHTKGKIILIGANCPPQALTEIESRLISRFEWGISLLLEKLEKKELKILIKNEQRILNISLDPKLEKFILENFSNPTSIKKAIKTIALNSHLENIDNIDEKKASVYLSSLLNEEKTFCLNHEKILDEVSLYYGISKNDILGKSQTRQCALPRQFAMFFCRELLKFPYMKIGSVFTRDHSTVMTSIGAIRSMLEKKDDKILSAHQIILKKLSCYN